jgi:hypothetical protein
MEVRFGEKLKAAPKHDLGGEPGTDGPLLVGLRKSCGARGTTYLCLGSNIIYWRCLLLSP